MLTSKELIKDLGTVKVKNTKEFGYEVTNHGPSPISIDKVTVGCGSCTKATMIGNVIKPQETKVLSVAFTPATTGSQKKYVNIRYNTTETLKLEFTAEVI